MILSRAEFNRRWTDRDFAIEKQIIEDFDVLTLMKELKLDAKFRNHEYMFNGRDLDKLPLQETTIGILKTNPDIKTEGERLSAVKKELENKTYFPVEIFQDIDHPTIIYVNDGFHRIVGAYQLGMKTIRCEIKQGHYKLSDTLRIRDLVEHIDMLKQLVGEKNLMKLNKIVDKKTKDGILFGDIMIR